MIALIDQFIGKHNNNNRPYIFGGFDSYQILPTHSASAPFQNPEARQTFVLRMSLGMSKPSSHPNVHIDLK